MSSSLNREKRGAEGLKEKKNASSYEKVSTKKSTSSSLSCE